MNIQTLSIIGISLAMDAFGVTLGIGINKNIKKQKILMYVLLCSFFQFLFAFLGGIFGYCFNTYITALPSTAGAIIMITIGSMMIIDGVRKKENFFIFKTSTILLLAVSVSIDALIIGFTVLFNVNNYIILTINSIYIGLITLLLCTLATFLCSIFTKVNCIEKYSNFIGGISLILLGIKMLIK